MTALARVDLVLKDVAGKGHGVFAARPFAPGERVLAFVGELCDVATLADLTHALQVGPRTFIAPSGGIDDFVNHSCDPNTGIAERDGEVILFALGEIAPGDEITFDYATTQTGGFGVFRCACGSARCRGIVGDFGDLPDDLKAFYTRRRAVLPFLLEER